MTSLHDFSPALFEFDRELIARLDRSGPRYTSYPTADHFSADFNADTYCQVISKRHIGSQGRPLSLYVHLPFCDTVCYYCACNKTITKNHRQADRYLDYLEKEVQLVAQQLGGREKVAQLHLGGGTPTFLSDTQLSRLMAILQQAFILLPDGELSIEIDPRKIRPTTIRLLASLGFNRLSVGVQDVDSAVQKAVNRVQSLAETQSVIDTAREAGFKSVSVDLIYGLPLQTQASVARTMEQVIALMPDRIALYNYAHMPGRFMPQRRINEADLPVPAMKIDILQRSVQQLSDAGYVFVGMDHFAKPEDDLAIALRQGRLQRNFQGYSTHADCDMLAFGVSAIGKVGPSYVQNHKDLEAWYTALDHGVLPVMRGLVLKADDILRRSVIQALMCRFSLSVAAIEEVFNINFSAYFSRELPKVQEFQMLGLLEFDGEFLTVAAKGRLLIRNIAMIFDRYLQEKTLADRYSSLV